MTLRVVLAVNALLRHGPGMVVWALARGLRTQGCQVWVFSLDTPDPILAQELTQAGVTVLEVGAAWRTWRQSLTEARPDIVHTHGLRADIFGRIAARLARVPLILSTIHDSPAMYALALGRWRGALALGLQLITLPLVTQVVMVSHTTAAEYRVLRPWGRLTRRTVVIHNGVRDCARSARAGTQDRLVVGALGRLTRRKGIHLLLDAAVRLHTTHPQVHFQVAGEGELEADLAARLAAEGLESAFELCGPLKDVSGFLAGLDLFVLPSLDECLPLAVLEAMSAGLPVLASDVGGVSEAIQHDQTGWLTPANDVGALTGALALLLDDAALRARLGAAARQSYVTRFTLVAMTERYRALYRQLRATCP